MHRLAGPPADPEFDICTFTRPIAGWAAFPRSAGPYIHTVSRPPLILRSKKEAGRQPKPNPQLTKFRAASRDTSRYVAVYHIARAIQTFSCTASLPSCCPFLHDTLSLHFLLVRAHAQMSNCQPRALFFRGAWLAVW